MGSVWKQVHVLSTHIPEYPSPYFLGLCVDQIDPLAVDWNEWDSEVETIYYHPSLHQQLFTLPRETEQFFTPSGSGSYTYSWEYGGTETTVNANTEEPSTSTTSTHTASADDLNFYIEEL